MPKITIDLDQQYLDVVLGRAKGSHAEGDAAEACASIVRTVVAAQVGHPPARLALAALLGDTASEDERLAALMNAPPDPDEPKH